MGKLIILVGLGIALIGALYTYLPQTVNWFGNLPGDIKIDKPSVRVFFPITSMIIVSIIISVLMRIYNMIQ